MNYEWIGKPLRKKSDQKIEKTVKIKVKLPHVNKKPLARKPIFVQTLFSHSTLKLERKIHAAKQLAFSVHFLFRRDQNHYSNLTSKIKKMCEQILKKQLPNTIQILWIVKNQEKANNSPSFRCAAINKTWEFYYSSHLSRRLKNNRVAVTEQCKKSDI